MEAFFFHREDLDGTELRTAYASSVRAFRSALEHFEHPVRVLSGPVSDYLFTPGHTDGKCPAILHVGGYDSTAEELYAAVAPAVERGYAFAALDGPGQGAALYDQRVPMRPDWENVVPPMFDAVTADQKVDPGRVVLVGRSFGGLIAPRGAAGEHRLAAMIVDPGQYDLGTAVTARLGPLMDQVNDPAADPQFDALLDIPAVKALLGPRMATHGVTSVRAYFADVLRYTNADTVTRVVCPTFVTDNETDEVRPVRARSSSSTSPALRNSGSSRRKRGPKAIVKGWPPSCSGMPHSTGLTHCCQTDRQAHLGAGAPFYRRRTNLARRRTYPARLSSTARSQPRQH